MNGFQADKESEEDTNIENSGKKKNRKGKTQVDHRRPADL